MFIDVKKAHLNGKVLDDEFACVKLPDGKIWRLKRWLYGMRSAAQAWEEEYASKMIYIGFAREYRIRPCFTDRARARRRLHVFVPRGPWRRARRQDGPVVRFDSASCGR